MIEWLLSCRGLFLGLMLSALWGCGDGPDSGAEARAARPALSVRLIHPSMDEMPLTLEANGSIAAWQEALISAELGGVRLVEILADVGDRVKKGQVLARFDRERVKADLEQSQASLQEAEASLQEARENARRVRTIIDEGALSALQAGQYLTLEKTAEARLRGARAQVDIQSLRLRHTEVIANDEGVISARSATLGDVPMEGHALFRLVRQERLEWRAEVTAAEFPKIRPGLGVSVEVPDVGRIAGRVRMVGPTLDETRRYGLVYVDLEGASLAGFRSGMFAHGRFELGQQQALGIPRSAILLRDGFSFVFKVHRESPERGRVELARVTLGRSEGDQVEIIEGLGADEAVVESGAAFLADGDQVRIIP